MANDLTINQISTILADVVAQATGKNVITPTNTSEFITLGQIALQCGFDPILNSLSQTLGRTIFSVRPYTRKFQNMNVSKQRYGNHVRKIQSMDSSWVKNDEWELQNGKSVDMYVINKPPMVQTNFYGWETFARFTTIFRDQLNVALTGPDQFQSLLTMIMTNASDQIEQVHESMARMIVANMAGGIYEMATATPAVNPERVVFLLTEYNTETNQALSKEQVLRAEYFDSFIKWCYARISSIQELLTNRGYLYHSAIGNNTIPRHTPMMDQRLYVTSAYYKLIQTSVISSVFQRDVMNFAPHESVSFWQSPESYDQIQVTPVILNAAGNAVTGTEQTISNIFAILFDWEAMGLTTFNEWTSTTPLNSGGGYYNIWWHFTERYWNDLTENAVLFLLE